MINKKKIFITSSALAVIILVGFYFFSQTKESVLLTTKFQTCPYGHYKLKAIPILYGLPAFDSTLVKKIENNEVYLGGCVITENSPEYQVLCEKCGFELGQEAGQKYWIRNSSNINSFEIPLEDFLQQFPLVRLDTSSSQRGFLSYNQEIRNGTSVRESVRFTSLNSYLDFEKVFSDYLRNKDIKIQKKEFLKTDTGKDTLVTLQITAANKEDYEYILKSSEYLPSDSLALVNLIWRRNDIKY